MGGAQEKVLSALQFDNADEITADHQSFLSEKNRQINV